MTQETDYPSTFLRGIPNRSPQFFNTLGEPTGYVFRPHDDQVSINGFYYQSINWEDDDTVEEFTLSERKADGTLQFKGGAVRVSKDDIDQLIQTPPYIGINSYNRDPVEENSDEEIRGNPYHGNLLLDENRMDTKPNRRALFGQLKLVLGDLIPPKEE